MTGQRPFDPEHRPDPRRVTVHRGVIFNPWVNIPVCVLCTLGLAAATWWAIAQHAEVSAAAPYPDQGLDAVGTLIAAVVFGLATITLLVCTILTARWWARRLRDDRARRHRG